MSAIAWIVLGLVSGFLASKLAGRGGLGVVRDTALGIIGACVGGLLFHLIGRHGVTGLNLWSLAVAVVGAVVTLVLFHTVRRIA